MNARKIDSDDYLYIIILYIRILIEYYNLYHFISCLYAIYENCSSISAKLFLFLFFRYILVNALPFILLQMRIKL